MGLLPRILAGVNNFLFAEYRDVCGQPTNMGPKEKQYMENMAKGVRTPHKFSTSSFSLCANMQDA